MDFTIVDIETTGLDPAKDEVIELCVLRVEWPSFKIVGSMYRRIRPEKPLSEEVMAVNGYSVEAWARAASWWTRPDIKALADLLRGARWVGSGPRFDFDFLDRIRREFDEPTFELRSRRLIDVGTLGLPLLLAVAPESGGGQDAILDALTKLDGADPMARAEQFAIDVDSPDRSGRHTAIGDAFGVLHILERLLPPIVGLWKAPPPGAERRDGAWTKRRHEAARARCKAATPGPWECMPGRPANADDAAFIVAAREDIPDMLDEIDRLAREADGLRVSLQTTEDMRSRTALDLTTASAEIERLKSNFTAAAADIRIAEHAAAKERVDRCLAEIERLNSDRERGEHWAYNLGQRHGKALAAPDRVAAAIPIDDLARALWGARDNDETWDDIVHDHKLDPPGSLLSRARDEAGAVQALIVARLAEDAKRHRPAEPDTGTAWGRLEALVLAGPVELRAAWNDWKIARETETSHENRAPHRGIYVASRVRYADMWRAARAGGAPIVSTWIDEAGPGESEDLSDLAVRCIQEATSAAALVYYSATGDEPALKGAMVEVGAALAHGVAVLSVGMPPGAFIHHPLVTLFDTHEDALAAAVKIAQEAEERSAIPEPAAFTPDGAALDFLRAHVRAVKESMGDLSALGGALGDLFKAAGEKAHDARREQLRGGAAAIDAAAASVGALLVEVREPALLAGARRAVEEQRRAMVPPMSKSTPPNVGTPPDPGVVLHFTFTHTGDRVLSWSQLANAPNGGKVLPALRRGERALFGVPDGTTWGLARAEDGTLTIFASR